MIRVIFIDDNKLVLKSIKNVVNEFIIDGIITCEFYLEPLKLYDELKNEDLDFDILFSDINMPVMDGYQLVKKIRNIKKYHRKPIVAMTTEISLESKIKGKSCGMNGWISKIAAPDAMKSAIKKILDKIEK
jgi:two-component system chemotaxis response regulator CheY